MNHESLFLLAICFGFYAIVTAVVGAFGRYFEAMMDKSKDKSGLDVYLEKMKEMERNA
jgi:hypothetical protein